MPQELRSLPLWGGGFVLLDGVSIPATLELSENSLRQVHDETVCGNNETSMLARVVVCYRAGFMCCLHLPKLLVHGLLQPGALRVSAAAQLRSPAPGAAVWCPGRSRLPTAWGMLACLSRMMAYLSCLLLDECDPSLSQRPLPTWASTASSLTGHVPPAHHCLTAAPHWSLAPAAAAPSPPGSPRR